MPVTEHSLGAVTLSGLVIVDDVSHTGVRSEVTKTLAGGVVIWETAEQSGRLIELRGGEDFGWLLRSSLQALRAMAAVPGATYTLTTPEEVFTVRFCNETPPAISATPLVARPNQAAGDYYNNVTIKLMEV